MRITKHYSLAHADKVLALVKHLVKDKATTTGDLIQEAWANCREQGYALTAYSTNIVCCPKLVFAQSRGSEQVVVVFGFIGEFDHQTNQPNELVWKSRKEFNDDCKAAEFIVKFLVGGK